MMMYIERERGVDSDDEPQITEIKKTLNSLRTFLGEHNQFGTFQVDNNVLSDLEEQVDFIGRPYLRVPLFFDIP